VYERLLAWQLSQGYPSLHPTALQLLLQQL